MPTCTSSSSSGSSFIAKMPRCIRGISPKWSASSLAMLVPPASFAGSISPMMSANFVPGASRSAYRSSRGHQAIGMSAGSRSATSRLPTRLIGRSGSSWKGIAGSSMKGRCSSRNRTSSRISRLLACPFSPRKSMS